MATISAETGLAVCDLHSHFLPGMDDGCRNEEESLAVLKASYAQGVRSIFATPHYYPVETVDAFLERRQKAMQKLSAWLSREEDLIIPRICLGAEVAFRPGLRYEENLDKLCLGKSRYLLLELPFSRWGGEVVREIRGICNGRGITPILAHFERYLDVQQHDVIGRILELDVLVQMNAVYLTRFFSRRKGCNQIKNNVVQLLGSDCHNMTTRPPDLGEAFAYLRKRGMDDAVERIIALGCGIFHEATGE